MTESKKTPFRVVNEDKDMGIDTPEGFIGNANIEQGQTNEALVSKERSLSTGRVSFRERFGAWRRGREP